MIGFNAASLGDTFAELARLAEVTAKNGNVTEWRQTQIMTLLNTIELWGKTLEIEESHDCARRLRNDFEGAFGLENQEVHHGLRHLADLIKNELFKRKAFVIQETKTKYFRDEKENQSDPKKELFLFSPRAETAFPSSNMDIIEAGRCLALNRNNAAVYHLMQVAEIGLRVLAWDRRVAVWRGKSKTVMPLEFAQWGELIGELEKKVSQINSWPRSKGTRERAIQFYKSAIFDVSSFNEIYRKHISHARSTLYPEDTAVTCWGHVSRFMDRISERMSEDYRTKMVWPVEK